ncbi:MAG: hypothetical protein K2V38_06160 [Gemmataceae bacterium]|nr:hypothetical protein [Gemmataceae bacterium]
MGSPERGGSTFVHCRRPDPSGQGSLAAARRPARGTVGTTRRTRRDRHAGCHPISPPEPLKGYTVSMPHVPPAPGPDVATQPHPTPKPDPIPPTEVDPPTRTPENPAIPYPVHPPAPPPAPTVPPTWG